jgi:hypothetical protein
MSIKSQSELSINNESVSNYSEMLATAISLLTAIEEVQRKNLSNLRLDFNASQDKLTASAWQNVDFDKETLRLKLHALESQIMLENTAKNLIKSARKNLDNISTLEPVQTVDKNESTPIKNFIDNGHFLSSIKANNIKTMEELIEYMNKNNNNLSSLKFCGPGTRRAIQLAVDKFKNNIEIEKP